MSQLITEIRSDKDLKTAKEQISFLTSLINNRGGGGGGKSSSSKQIISTICDENFYFDKALESTLNGKRNKSILRINSKKYGLMLVKLDITLWNLSNTLNTREIYLFQKNTKDTNYCFNYKSDYTWAPTGDPKYPYGANTLDYEGNNGYSFNRPISKKDANNWIHFVLLYKEG